MFLRGGEGGKEQETAEPAHNMAPAHLDHVELPEQRIKKVTMVQQATTRWRCMAHLDHVELPEQRIPRDQLTIFRLIATKWPSLITWSYLNKE